MQTSNIVKKFSFTENGSFIQLVDSTTVDSVHTIIVAACIKDLSMADFTHAIQENAELIFQFSKCIEEVERMRQVVIDNKDRIDLTDEQINEIVFIKHKLTKIDEIIEKGKESHTLHTNKIIEACNKTEILDRKLQEKEEEIADLNKLITNLKKL